MEYRYRASLLSKERSFRLDSHQLLVSDREPLHFADIRKIRIYDSPGANTLGGTSLSPGFRRCVIWPTHGRAIILSSNHFVGFANIENHRESFDPFVDALIVRVAKANPATIFIAGMPMALWLFWLLTLASVMIVVPLAILTIIAEMIEEQKFDGLLVLSTIILLGVFCGFIPLAITLKRALPRKFDPRGYASTAT